MASISYADGDDLVILKCSDSHQTKPEADDRETIISTADIAGWDFPSILRHQIVTVKASRNSLIEHSSYFHALFCSGFRESCPKCISIKWNLETFMNILKFIFGFPMDITSNNFLALYEGALFFGVEILLLKCKDWLIDVASLKGLCSQQIQLDDLLQIWNFGIEHETDFIQELCTSYLARNFMWAVFCNSFPHVPYSLLVSCVKHPDLTVFSERHLADAFSVWLAANEIESLSRTRDDCTSILKEFFTLQHFYWCNCAINFSFLHLFIILFEHIRISLLPLWFAEGKIRCCYFSKLAEESIDAILNLMAHQSARMMDFLGGDDSHQFKIRLTRYTKKVDLSGCPQMNVMILLMSVLPSSYVANLIKTNIVKHLDGYRRMIDWAALPTLTFEAVEEVDISNCPRLDLEAAIECLCCSFPCLRVLKAAHFLKFKTMKLSRLLKKCPLLVEIDLTVDISPVIPSPTVHSNPEKTSHSHVYFGDYQKTLSGKLITKLTLEGRLDLNDCDLENVAESCASLCYLNIRGCPIVTDAGITVVVLRCLKLHSLLVCYTSFGYDSILALTSGVSSLNCFPTHQIESANAKSLASKLQLLHMGGCNGVDSTIISKLIAETPMLKSLCLRETQITDETLHGFLGCSLDMLDVSDTQVSSAALAHIISRNPGMKCLKARGCKNLFHQKSMNDGICFPFIEYSCKESYIDLGKSCNLEEIALGWGFSYFSLEALRPAITTLRAITVGLGASLGQGALELLPTTCPMLESVILYFQVISDCVIINLVESLRQLQVLALCHCLGEISPLSFKFQMPNLRKLRLERITPWMTNGDLINLTQNCANLVEFSLIGCRLLNSDSQQVISKGWPGLISIHLEDCGEVTKNGVDSLFECKALGDIVLRHNGPGIPNNFIIVAVSMMPMLRKLSLDICDASEGDFNFPRFNDRNSLRIIKIARCKHQRCSSESERLRRTPMHEETLVLVQDSGTVKRTLIKERL